MRQFAKRLARWGDYVLAKAVPGIAERTGILVAVLCHSVFESEEDARSGVVHPQQGVTLEHLEQLIAFFQRRRFTFVSPADIEHGLDAHRGHILLTFDDGYYNNSLVLPLLRMRDVPAVFFITTGHVLANKAFWWDVLYRHHLRQGRSEADLVTEARKLKRLRHDEIDAYLQAEFGPGALLPESDQDRPFTPEELRCFAENPHVHLGNHTHDHAILTNYTFDEMVSQLAKCQESLRAISGIEPAIVAYPNGSLNERVLMAAQQVGLRLGISVQAHTNRLPVRLPAMSLGRHVLWGNQNIGRQCATFCVRFSLEQILAPIGRLV